MKLLLIILLTFIQFFGSAQALDKKTEVENIFNSLRGQNIITKTIANNPSWITSYQFEGDYSREKVFPNTPSTWTICLNPIAFESPIYNTLKQIDYSYDSAYYQKQIQERVASKWSNQGLQFTTKITFTKPGITRNLIRKVGSEIGIISYPLFSKDGQTAIITYHTLNGNSKIKQPRKVYFLKRNEKEWTIVMTIGPKKW